MVLRKRKNWQINLSLLLGIVGLLYAINAANQERTLREYLPLFGSPPTTTLDHIVVVEAATGRAVTLAPPEYSMDTLWAVVNSVAYPWGDGVKSVYSYAAASHVSPAKYTLFIYVEGEAEAVYTATLHTVAATVEITPATPITSNEVTFTIRAGHLFPLVLKGEKDLLAGVNEFGTHPVLTEWKGQYYIYKTPKTKNTLGPHKIVLDLLTELFP